MTVSAVFPELVITSLIVPLPKALKPLKLPDDADAVQKNVVPTISALGVKFGDSPLQITVPKGKGAFITGPGDIVTFTAAISVHPLSLWI